MIYLKDDILDCFSDLLVNAGKNYDNALMDISFEKDNQKYIKPIWEVLSNLPEDFELYLKDDK